MILQVIKTSWVRRFEKQCLLYSNGLTSSSSNVTFNLLNAFQKHWNWNLQNTKQNQPFSQNLLIGEIALLILLFTENVRFSYIHIPCKGCGFTFALPHIEKLHKTGWRECVEIVISWVILAANITWNFHLFSSQNITLEKSRAVGKYKLGFNNSTWQGYCCTAFLY